MRETIEWQRPRRREPEWEMTLSHRIFTAVLAVLIALGTLTVPGAVREGAARSNTAPVIGTQASTSLRYLFPRGEKAVLDFSSAPVSDTDGDSTTVRFTFTVPDISTTDDVTDTRDTTPAEALFEVSRNGHDFEFTAKDGLTPGDFTALYGNTTSRSVPVKMYANDGTADSEPLAFTITASHDASPQFGQPAAHQSEQRWAVAGAYEMYEGITQVTGLSVPWSAVKQGNRNWSAGTPGISDIKCADQSGDVAGSWPEEGDRDSGLFDVASAANAASGTVTASFKTAPDFENPADDEGTSRVDGQEQANPGDNTYRLRVVSTHDIHDLEGAGSGLGCNGSALDLKIRVKDVGSPTPVKGPKLTLQPRNQARFSVYWDHPHANQFIEDGKAVDFPDPSFNVSQIVVSHSPTGLMQGGEPFPSPGQSAARISRIENLQGTPGTTYTITLQPTNSEGTLEPVSARITLPGPPAVPGAPTVRPESETSVGATWERSEDGGSPTTRHMVQYRKDGATRSADGPIPGPGPRHAGRAVYQ